MITLVTGGSKCGKSRYAEKILEGFQGRKFYIAAMKPFGADALEAIERHRLLRSGKGFETIEKYTDIGELSLPPGCGVLVECIGNLCANEMFQGRTVQSSSEKILSGIKALTVNAAETVIVTNQVGADGVPYPEGTAEYISELGAINTGIAALADNVVECVYGIPVILKGGRPC